MHYVRKFRNFEEILTAEWKGVQAQMHFVGVSRKNMVTIGSCGYGPTPPSSTVNGE